MAGSGSNRALFFDLVGTLIAMDETRQIPLDHRGNLVVEVLPGVVEKIRPMRDHLVFVATNQAGIKRGRLTAEQFEAAMAELDHKLGGILTAWRVCPHDDQDGCACRKPRTGMFTDLADSYGVDLQASTGVGDQETDERACRAAGVGRFIYARDFFGWK